MKAIVISNFEDDKYSLSNDYIRLLEANNILPIVINNLNLINIEQYVSMCDIVILTGGGDSDPSLYNETINNNISLDIVPIKRDIFEIKIIKEAIRQKKYILGICRGMQVINIALGGTLFQHIDNHFKVNHNIRIRDNSLLFNHFNKKQIHVNSIHHQAIKTLGKNLKATAVSKEDNYIEAIESFDKKILGLQWHIERIPNQFPLIQSFLKNIEDLSE